MEALHHRAQAHEMTEKLRVESQDNTRVMAFDVGVAKAMAADCDSEIKVLTQPSGQQRSVSFNLPDHPFILHPGQSAWISIRDSALLPIMPPLLIDNYWKVDSLNDKVTAQANDLVKAYRLAQAAADAANVAPDRPTLREGLLARLTEARQEAASYLATARLFQGANDRAFQGKPIDLDVAIGAEEARPR